MTDEQLKRLDDKRCPDDGVPLKFDRPPSPGMGVYECPECGQTFALSTS